MLLVLASVAAEDEKRQRESAATRLVTAIFMMTFRDESSSDFFHRMSLNGPQITVRIDFYVMTEFLLATNPLFLLGLQRLRRRIRKLAIVFAAA
jgi:hypothetical protein